MTVSDAMNGLRETWSERPTGNHVASSTLQRTKLLLTIFWWKKKLALVHTTEVYGTRREQGFDQAWYNDSTPMSKIYNALENILIKLWKQANVSVFYHDYSSLLFADFFFCFLFKSSPLLLFIFSCRDNMIVRRTKKNFNFTLTQTAWILTTVVQGRFSWLQRTRQWNKQNCFSTGHRHHRGPKKKTIHLMLMDVL